MTPLLLVGIAGLAALDSLNPATIVAVALILLASRRRPVVEAMAYVKGALATVLTPGVAVSLGADAAPGAVADGLVWLRRVAFGRDAVDVLMDSTPNGTGR